MKDVREILSNLNAGTIEISDIPDGLILQLCSYMLFEELEGPDELISQLSPLQRDVLGLQGMLVEGDLANAVITSEELLTRSRLGAQKKSEIWNARLGFVWKGHYSQLRAQRSRVKN